MIYLNGSFLPLEQARIPVLDRGFIFGDGIYEVIPVYSRQPFRLAEHLSRLERSLAGIRLPNPHSAAPPFRDERPMSDILMPKATAVWLVDNTSLSFEQIADFCGLHPLEVRGIADGDVARDIRGVDPVTGGQLTREELDKAQADENYRLKAIVSRHAELMKSAKPAPKYTPVSRRQDRPDAIAWFVRNHPEVTDAQIAKLLGTTKSTIESVRNRTHWNSANIKPVDPVTLGLVGQLVLDEIVKKAADKKTKDDLKKGGGTIQPVEEVEAEPEFVPEARQRPGAEPTAASVFGTKD